MQGKGETFVYTVGWIVGGIVILGIVAAIFFAVTGPDGGAANDLRRYEICVANGGTFIEGTTDSAELCISNGEVKVTKEVPNG